MFGGTVDGRTDSAAFSSVGFADKLTGTPAGDFWSAEVAWQREECSKSFEVKVCRKLAPASMRACLIVHGASGKKIHCCL